MDNPDYTITPGSAEDRAVGSLVGLAIGDALGSSVEFMERGSFDPVSSMRGGGPFNLNPGEWTDDTSMALALADALMEDGDLEDPSTIMDRWSKWYQHGEYSYNGRCFDIGNQTRRSLDQWISHKELPFVSEGAGNGGIMRLAPVVIMHYRNLQHMRGIVERQTVLTHNNDLCVHIAETMAMRMAMSFDGGIETAKKLISPVYLDMPDTKIKSTGYVEDTYQAASWAVINTSSFKEALLLAVNLGDDADTIGAVTGQIAGAAYGFSSIPEDWLAVLAWRDRIVASGRSLFWNSSKAKPQTTISHF